MKRRALYHLMLSAARSARQLVDADQAAEIDARARSLEVSRAQRGTLELSWSTRTGRDSLTIDSRRFDFYARGDVPTIVAKRPSDIDLRSANWEEAHRLWGELIGDEGLAALAHSRSPDRAATTAPAAGHADLAALVSPVGLLGGVIIALTVDSALAIAGGLALVVAGLTRRFWPVTAAAALIASIVAVEGADIGNNEVAGATAGVALVVAATMLAPVVPVRPTTRLIVVGLAAAAAVLAAPAAGATFGIAAALLVVIDIAALMLRSDMGRVAGTLVAAVVVSIGGLALDGPIDWPARPWDSESPTWLISTTIVCVVVIALLVGWAFFRGVRDRLSLWLAPAVLCVVALIRIDATVTGIWMGVLVAVVVVDSFEIPSRWIRRRRSAPPPSGGTRSVPVTIEGRTSV